MTKRKFNPGKLTVSDLADLGRYLGVQFEFVFVPNHDAEEYRALLQVAGAARFYRMDAKTGRKMLLDALESLDDVQTPTGEEKAKLTGAEGERV